MVVYTRCLKKPCMRVTPQNSHNNGTHATAEFISPDHWPPNSTDINPVEYKIWCQVPSSELGESEVSDVNELKHRLVKVWSHFGQTIIDEAIDEWKE